MALRRPVLAMRQNQKHGKPVAQLADDIGVHRSSVRIWVEVWDRWRESEPATRPLFAERTIWSQVEPAEWSRLIPGVNDSGRRFFSITTKISRRDPRPCPHELSLIHISEPTRL